MSEKNLYERYFTKLSFCPICNGKNISVVIESKYQDIAFQIATCQSCGINFTVPQLKQEFVSNLYSGGVSDGKPMTKNNFLRKLRRFKLKLLFKKMQRFYGLNSTKNILDYGCGDGVFTEILKKNCKNAIGVDITLSLDQQDNVDQYLLHAKFIGSSKFFNEFDYILLRHVLEHTINPNIFLLDLSKFLKKKGKFIIEVPNFDSPWRRIFKKNYSQLGLPFHTFHFTPKNIHKAIPDFKIIHIKNTTVPILAKSLFNIFDINISQLGIFAAFLYPLELLISIFLNHSTAMLLLCSPLNYKDARDNYDVSQETL